MNGLINSQMSPEQLEAQSPEMQGEQQDLTAEEQQAYDRFMLGVNRVLYEKGYDELIVEQLKSTKDIVSAMADQAYDLMSELDRKSGAMLPDDLIAAAAFDVLGEVATVARAAGAQITGAQISGAAQKMIVRYFEENGATPEEIQQLMQGVDINAMGAEMDAQLQGEMQ